MPYYWVQILNFKAFSKKEEPTIQEEVKKLKRGTNLETRTHQSKFQIQYKD